MEVQSYGTKSIVSPNHEPTNNRSTSYPLGICQRFQLDYIDLSQNNQKNWGSGWVHTNCAGVVFESVPRKNQSGTVSNRQIPK